jgi:hypothetical protein
VRIHVAFVCVQSRPVSAYALFFRDTQAAIKSRNPKASFGDISKTVASMWDTLDGETKNVSATLPHSIRMITAINLRTLHYTASTSTSSFANRLIT